MNNACAIDHILQSWTRMMTVDAYKFLGLHNSLWMAQNNSDTKKYSLLHFTHILIEKKTVIFYNQYLSLSLSIRTQAYLRKYSRKSTKNCWRIGQRMECRVVHLKKAAVRARNDAQYCDIFFMLEGNLFKLHKLVLSGFMRRYISLNSRRNMKGSGTSPFDPIQLKSFPGRVSAFQDLIKYCYADDSFAIHFGNVASLYYASDYFMMSQHRDSLPHDIDQYLTNDVEKASLSEQFALYQTSVELETKFSLPHKFSQKCADILARCLKNADEESVQKMILEIPQNTRYLAPQTLVGALKRHNLSEFLADMVLTNDLTEKKELGKTCIAALDVSSLKPSKFERLIQLNSDLFSKVQHDKIGLISSYVGSHEMTEYIEISQRDSIALGRQFLKICKQLFDSSEEKSQQIFFAMESIINMLLYKLGFTIEVETEGINLDEELKSAISNKDNGIIPFLLSAGANVNLWESEHWWDQSALSYACYERNNNAFELLVNAGAALHGYTFPLLVVFFRTKNSAPATNLHILHRLIDLGVDVNEQDSEGETALMMAESTECWDAVDILKAAGAK